MIPERLSVSKPLEMPRSVAAPRTAVSKTSAEALPRETVQLTTRAPKSAEPPRTPVARAPETPAPPVAEARQPLAVWQGPLVQFDDGPECLRAYVDHTLETTIQQAPSQVTGDSNVSLMSWDGVPLSGLHSAEIEARGGQVKRFQGTLQTPDGEVRVEKFNMAGSTTGLRAAAASTVGWVGTALLWASGAARASGRVVGAVGDRVGTRVLEGYGNVGTMGMKEGDGRPAAALGFDVLANTLGAANDLAAGLTRLVLSPIARPLAAAGAPLVGLGMKLATDPNGETIYRRTGPDGVTESAIYRPDGSLREYHKSTG
ncbi:MAG: hypothetical protein HY319_31930 [Armatimonadetes bacterium]|nr:hypothetical protein [Armatimonadota bacterium]